jgi:four helix bundle protein
MYHHFRTYKLAVDFHRRCRSLALPDYLKDQLLRASSSIALNLAEGSGRSTQKDQLRFFHQAMGSLRECQAALDLAPKQNTALVVAGDQLGAHLYRLCASKRR